MWPMDHSWRNTDFFPSPLNEVVKLTSAHADITDLVKD